MRRHRKPEKKESANVARFLPLLAHRTPERIAVRAPHGRIADGSINYQSLTFAELNAGADACARLLESRGVTAGKRVLLMVRPGLDLIQLCFALFKMGAVPVVIDPGMGLKSFLHCVRHTKPQYLVGIPVAVVLSHVFRGSFASLRGRVMIAGGWRRLVNRHRAGQGYRMAESKPRDLAAILFTSGSTGRPKGVCYEHGMFSAQVELIRNAYKIEPGEVDLPMLPIFALFNPAFGMTTIVPEMNPSRPAKVDPAKLVQAIHQNQVTNSFGSPVLWTRIGRHCKEHGIQLPSLKRVLMAGAPVSPGLLKLMSEVAPNAALHTPYGATECLPVTSVSSHEVLNDTWEATLQGRGTCVGHPLPGITVVIIPVSEKPVADFSATRLLDPFQVGEIVVGGPVVTQAYDQLPEENDRSKIRYLDGRKWHRIGDLGYLDDSGRLWFCGRKAERVQTSEGDMYTDCCEAIFNAHPAVYRSALIGLGTVGAQIPAIVIEPEPGQTLDLEELRALAQKYPHTQNIREFFIHGPFPVDVRHNAKIHRLTLQRHYNKTASKS